MLLTAVLAWIFSVSSWAQPLPEIPALSAAELEKFDAPSRERIQKAYQRAQESTQDGEANGRLGMTLHGFGLYEHAAVYYRRARRLEPKSFRWVYYLGVTQSELGLERRP